MWKNFVSTVANQIYLDLPPSITQISFDIFNRCSFRAILFKFEYISYSNISLSTQISQIFHEPGTILTIILPKHRTSTFSRFLFCIFTIYIQFSSNKRTHCSNQHEKFHSFILVNDASSFSTLSFEAQNIPRSIVHDLLEISISLARSSPAKLQSPPTPKSVPS